MQINARDWKFEVSEDPSIATPVWAQINGIESFDLNPSDGEAETETTTFGSNGIYEGQAMQRGASLSVSGKIVRDKATKAQDPGQLAVENLSVLVGEASLGGVRFRHKDDTSWTVWTAWVSKGNNGGGNNDKTTWSATFKRSGAPTTVAAP